MNGLLDGFDLQLLEPGKTYDVSPAFAAFLIEVAAAQLIPDESPALLTPLRDPPADPAASLAPVFKKSGFSDTET